jgi:hypothetical protein
MIFKYIPLVFLFITFPYKNCFAQISLRLNLEGGYYQSTSKFPLESGQKDATARADGEIGYKYDNDDHLISLKLRARPEVYGVNNNLKILKLKTFGTYFFKGDNLNWGIDLTGQKNYYNGRNLNLSYDDIIFMFESLLKINNVFSLSINTGYGYQKISNDINQKMDLIFLDSEIFQQLSGITKIGYGIYSERFILNNKFESESINNKGWRVGPHLSFYYLKSFLLNIDYRFLFHISEITKTPSYEHWIRLVAGKLLNDYWSVFILTDYYFRRYTVTENIKYVSLYTPINEDNRIYFKISYSLFDYLELYMKAGYFRENLYNNYSFAGWNALIGFEIEN